MVDLFDAYFRQADLDRDGRISGDEAVLFSQGSNLPNHVLAQVWTYANQNKTDFLGRPEFYNLLRLITVAQSGRELTPDIVKAALQGPAAAKIPPPQINSLRAPATPANAVPPQPTHVGAMRPNAFQNQVRGQQAIPPNMGMNQQFFPFANSNLVRPPQGTPPSGPLPMQGGNVVGPRFPGSNTPNLSTDWLGGRPSGAAGPTSQFPNRGVAPVNQDGSSLAQVGMAPGVTPGLQTQSSPSPSVQPRPSDQVLPSASKDSSALVVSGNGFSSDSVFGGDMFSVAPQAKQEASASTASSFSGQSSNIASGFQNPANPGQPNNLQGSVASSHGIQLPSQSLVKQNQLDTVHTTSTLPTYNVSSVPVTPTSNAAQHPWPKMTQSNIQKYTKVFVEVDKDRDGKITGEEARSLFLSWRLPREVLKQVWDLSDQDNDSMLSLREFCIALYLMERYREGRPLPAVLPNSLRFDETLLQCTGQPPNTHTGTAWQRQPGLIPQGIPSPRPAMPHGVMKPPRAPLPSLPEETVLPQQQKARVPVVEEHLLNQLCEEERKAINSKFQEALDADKKVQELEKEILDSREKIEYYRSNMQELVLYKSRCDNRHNEITERVSVAKREVESLAKKYEDKYKQTGDVASKLSLDEATFRAIQERKLELYNAIVKMEQGGTADGVLQARVDKIHSDLEELVKSLSERCKQYGLRAQPTTLVELPFGWQPGIQEEAADWDEDWDEFNHEGFAIIKELTVEVENTIAKPKPPTVCSDKTSNGKASSVLSSSIDENKNKTGKLDEPSELSSANEENKIDAEKPPTTLDHATEDESDYANSEDGSASSYHDSPRRSAVQSSSPESQSKQFGMHDLSTHAKDDQSDYGGAESTLSGEKFFDESSWGAKFDSNDDADSLWGFGSTNTKDNDHDKYHHDSFFGVGDFSLNPVRTESPSAESVYGADKKSAIFDSVPSTPSYNAESIYGTDKKSSFFDSVPSTPAYSFSPRFSDNPEDQAFDRFSRFNSFNMSDGGLFPPRDSFSRVDSMRGTAEPPAFGTFARFDSMKSTTGEPSFGSLSRFDSMRSTADPPPAGSLARFDSTHSTSDFGVGFLSFDDADPFGSSGPFKSESQSPGRSTDNWNAF